MAFRNSPRVYKGPVLPDWVQDLQQRQPRGSPGKSPLCKDGLDASSGRFFELGLEVTDAAPHIIGKCASLVGEDGAVLDRQPEAGDELVAINDCDVTHVRSLKKHTDLMYGSQNSVAKLTIRTRGSQQMVTVRVRRTIPSRLWQLFELTHRTIPLFDASLNEIFQELVTSEGLMRDPLDLPGDFGASLGLEATTDAWQGTPMARGVPVPTVTQVSTGSPAHMSGLEVGDAILEVDGIEATPSNIAQLLDTKKAAIGGPCDLVCRRAGKSVRFPMSWSRKSRLDMTARLLEIIRAVKAEVINPRAESAAQQRHERLSNALRKLEEHALSLAADAVETERFIFAKVSSLREGMLKHVADLRTGIASFPSSEDVWHELCVQAASGAEQTTRLVQTERDAATLRRQLDDAHRSIQSLSMNVTNLENEQARFFAIKRQVAQENTNLKGRLAEQEVAISAQNERELLEKIKALQDEVFSLTDQNKKLMVQCDEYDGHWRGQSELLPQMNALVTDKERLKKEIKTLQKSVSKHSAMETYCQTPATLFVSPDDVVKSFQRCDLRVDQVLRLMDILAEQQTGANRVGGGGWIVDEIAAFYRFLNEENMSFDRLVDHVEYVKTLEQKVVLAQEQAHDVRKMVYNERKFRMEAHEGFVECRNLVEASSDALSEWEPMIQALTRHPPVSISEMASALNRCPSSPRQIVDLLDSMSEFRAEVPDLIQVLRAVWANDQPNMNSIESVQRLFCRLSTLQAQRWRYKHLDASSMAGQLASKIKASSVPLIKESRLPEDSPEVKLMTVNAQQENARGMSSFLSSREGKARIAEVLRFQGEYEKMGGCVSDGFTSGEADQDGSHKRASAFSSAHSTHRHFGSDHLEQAQIDQEIDEHFSRGLLERRSDARRTLHRVGQLRAGDYGCPVCQTVLLRIAPD